MTEVKGVGRRITYLFDFLRNRRRYWKIEKDGNGSLSIEHKEEIHIFHKSRDVLISKYQIRFKLNAYLRPIINV